MEGDVWTTEFNRLCLKPDVKLTLSFLFGGVFSFPLNTFLVFGTFYFSTALCISEKKKILLLVFVCHSSDIFIVSVSVCCCPCSAKSKQIASEIYRVVLNRIWIEFLTWFVFNDGELEHARCVNKWGRRIRREFSWILFEQVEKRKVTERHRYTDVPPRELVEAEERKIGDYWSPPDGQKHNYK